MGAKSSSLPPQTTQAPSQEEKKTTKRHDYRDDFINATFLEKVFFTWLNNMQTEVEGKEVQGSDLWRLPAYDLCEEAARPLKKLWSEVETSAPNDANLYFKTLLSCFKKDIAIVFSLFAAWTVVVLLTNGLFLPSLLNVLTEFNQGLQPTVQIGSVKVPYNGFYWAIGFAGGETLRVLLINQQWFYAGMAGHKAKCATMLLIYEKGIRLRIPSNVGHVVNLTINDSQRLHEFSFYGAFLFVCPVVLIATAVVGCFVLSIAFLAGLAVLILAIPAQSKLGTYAAKLRGKQIAFTDSRVSLVAEILKSIKLTKFFSWEDKFASQVHQIRGEEVKILIQVAMFRALSFAVYLSIPAFVLLVSFSIHTLALNKPLTASSAFASIALLNTCRFPLMLLTTSVKVLLEGRISCNRIQTFLSENNDVQEIDLAKSNVEEEHPSIIEPSEKLLNPQVASATEVATTSFKNDNVLISVSEATFSWTKDGSGFVLSIPKLHVVSDFSKPFSNFVFVLGKTGSGKSSLLNTFFGNLLLLGGAMRLNLQYREIPFVSQQTFIFNGSVVDNVLLDEAFDRDLFNAVIHDCCLEADLLALPEGEKSELGEKGINLSGGQKSRINLARVLYYCRMNKERVKMVVLDDVFMALDAHTRDFILDRVFFSGKYFSTVVVLLSTHAIDLLLKFKGCKVVTINRATASEVVDVEDFSKGGRLFFNSIGSSDRLFTSFSSSNIVAASSSNAQGNASSDAGNKKLATEKQAKVFSGVLTTKEHAEVGTIKWSNFVFFLRSFSSSSLFMLLTLAFFVVSECLLAFVTTLVITNWISNGWQQPGNVYAVILFCVSVLTFLCVFVRSWGFSRVLLCSTLHDQAFTCLLRAKLNFFDVTPSGIILNRFSNDIEKIENAFIETTESAVSQLFRCFLSFIVVCVIFPFILIPFFFVFLLYFYLLWKYRSPLRKFKRVDLMSISPVLNHVESTMQGILTLRAFGYLQTKYKKRAVVLIDEAAKANFAFQLTARWIAVRLEFITVFLTFVSVIFCVFFASNIPSYLAGFALTSVLQTSGIFQFATRQLIEAEAQFSSVERLEYFIKQTPKEDGGLSDAFNSVVDGSIRVFDFSARYREDLPLVLNNVNVLIPAKSCVGLVGRTGSGKSSFIMALFRFLENQSGGIEIDGINIEKMTVKYLRSTVLSIIPQDPVLFKGTIRSNLDPFSVCSNEDVMNALTLLKAKKDDTALDEAYLNQEIAEDKNISSGEKQLVCFARSLLRNSKIVIVDEGTSSVDTNTAESIFDRLKIIFKERTLIVVAHRLTGMIDLMDFIAVFDMGALVEFDSPRNLLQIPNGFFTSLLRAAEGESDDATTRKSLNDSKKNN